MNKERIKILHVSKATGIAGSENHLLSLLPRLDRSKYEVTFMILIEQDKPLDDYFHMFEQKGIKTKRLIIRRDVDPKCLWEMYLFIRRNRFDIVHTHLVHADLYGTLAAKLAGVKCIVSTKHNDNNFRYNWFFKVVNKQLSNLNNRVITISQWLEKFSKEIEKINPNKLITIHYGLSLDSANYKANDDIREELRIAKDTVLIGTVARLVKQKGHIYLFEAMARIIEKRNDLKLLIAGDGHLRSDLEKQVERLGISNYVIFTGYRRDVFSIMKSIDIFVLPSLWEGFGLVLLEAMAACKPIVATEVSAIPEIVIHGDTGLLVSPRNSTDLANAITKLIENRELGRVLGLAGRERLTRFFTVEKMVKETEKLYESLFRS